MRVYFNLPISAGYLHNHWLTTAMYDVVIAVCWGEPTILHQLCVKIFVITSWIILYNKIIINYEKIDVIGNS